MVPDVKTQASRFSVKLAKGSCPTFLWNNEVYSSRMYAPHIPLGRVTSLGLRMAWDHAREPHDADPKRWVVLTKLSLVSAS
eukprot:1495957-Amphidinium_carterae.1